MLEEWIDGWMIIVFDMCCVLYFFGDMKEIDVLVSYDEE